MKRSPYGTWDYKKMTRNRPSSATARRQSQQAGFTLVESLVAITVFALGFLAVISMQSTSLSGNGQARYTTEATTQASGQVEFILNRSYADPLIADGLGSNNGLAGLDDGLTPNTNPDGQQVAGDYTLSWNIAENQPTGNAKTIRVIVTRDNLLPTPVKLDFIKIN